MAMDKGKEPTQEEQKRKSHGRRFFKKPEGEKKEGGVPLLKYGKGNNFRLVADGIDQDAELYPNKSSPTVAIHSVFTVLGLVATKTWRIVVKIDVKGAFLQTPMSGEPTFMKLDPKVLKYAVELFPNLKKMVEEDECLYTVLLKAMYGCVQASALWYVMIKAELEKLGYSVGPTDPCVFVKQVGNRIFILLLYVDDILAIVDKDEAEKIRAHLVAKF
jgi:hypothetical protein